jgi:signal transduction histidine kinase
LALIGVAALVADRLGRSVVLPIEDLVRATERLGSGELDASVTPSGPAELVQVGAAFNHLSHRVAQLLAGEREAIADLSHRLRTPLTALKLDVEALEPKVDTSRLQNDIDELERTVSHLINEARRPIREGGGATTDLTTVVGTRAEYWGALAEDQGRPWQVDLPPAPCRVAGRDTDFTAAIDAVIGNIFAHTPVGTPYRLAVTEHGGMAVLEVADDGPGVANRDLLERGRSSGNSTGLGIDIVRNTAEAAGGSAEWLSGSSGGTTVRIVVPQI